MQKGYNEFCVLIMGTVIILSLSVGVTSPSDTAIHMSSIKLSGRWELYQDHIAHSPTPPSPFIPAVLTTITTTTPGARQLDDIQQLTH